MTEFQDKDKTVSESSPKQEWRTPVLTSLDTEQTAGTFPGGDEADFGMTS